MNKEYIVFEDKAIVSDGNGNLKEISNTDNLDKVLVQENVVEGVEKEIRIYECAKDNIPKPSKKTWYFPLAGIGASLMILIMSYVDFGPQSFISTGNYMGSLAVSGIIMGTALVMTIPFAINDYKSKKDYNKLMKSLDTAIKYLKKRLDKEKETLLELKNDKNDEKPVEFKQVDDKKEQEELHNCSVNCLDIGYNGDKYYEYYLDGTLIEKLGENRARLFKEIINDNEQNFVKKIGSKKGR